MDCHVVIHKQQPWCNAAWLSSTVQAHLTLPGDSIGDCCRLALLSLSLMLLPKMILSASSMVLTPVSQSPDRRLAPAW